MAAGARRHLSANTYLYLLEEIYVKPGGMRNSSGILNRDVNERQPCQKFTGSKSRMCMKCQKTLIPGQSYRKSKNSRVSANKYRKDLIPRF